MNVPLLDLTAQYAPMKEEILSVVSEICDSQRFILGPKVENLEKELVSMRNDIDERAAKDCRVRILRFGDEVLHDKRHTKEHFDQILQDITEYDKYCESHKDFKNNMTVMTTVHIKDTYERCMEDRSFL